jgi:hypothetical protein
MTWTEIILDLLAYAFLLVFYLAFVGAMVRVEGHLLKIVELLRQLKESS